MPVFSLPSLPASHLSTFLDILTVSFLVYQFLLMIRGRRAASVILGLGMLLVLYQAAVWLRLDLLRTLLATLAPYSAFALIVMFQSEIRRMLARVGHRPWPTFGARVQTRQLLEEVLPALEQLAQEKTGALIVLEREIGLRTFVESGVNLEACVSRDLLLAVFQKNGPLHDGAVIVQGDRIAAAACFLPLSANMTVLRSFGTRHRAALGVTEEADCLALIVSEETGALATAAFGQLESGLTLAEVERRVLEHFQRQDKRTRVDAASPAAQLPENRSVGQV